MDSFKSSNKSLFSALFFGTVILFILYLIILGYLSNWSVSSASSLFFLLSPALIAFLGFILLVLFSVLLVGKETLEVYDDKLIYKRKQIVTEGNFSKLEKILVVRDVSSGGGDGVGGATVGFTLIFKSDKVNGYENILINKVNFKEAFVDLILLLKTKTKKTVSGDIWDEGLELIASSERDAFPKNFEKVYLIKKLPKN